MTDLIESEDELLDPQAGPPVVTPPHRVAAAWHRLRDRTPLRSVRSVRSVRETDPERHRRLVLAGLLAVAVAAGAGATGVAVHRGDLHGAQARTQDRTLLHLLGGSAALTLSESGDYGGVDLPGSLQTPLQAHFAIAVRNDGAKPVDVTNLRMTVPGVDVLATPGRMNLAPGDAESLTGLVAVHCDALNLREYPTGVTVSVRTSAAKGRPAGPSTTLTLAFDPGHPTADPGAGAVDELGGIVGNLGFTTTSSFYRLCGDALTLMPPQVSATAVTGSPAPSPQNPVVRYWLHIDSDAAQIAVPLPKPPIVPGVSAQSDLAGPAQMIGVEGLDVEVTDRITDCSQFGDYLAIRGGAEQAGASLNAATPIGLEPVDPRFRTTATPLSSAVQSQFDGLTPGTADLQTALLSQLAAVCPDL
ncbi:hypothetical protein KGQ20_20950 [Catenulispora sp. NF23]|uniref:DUF11 domain-containing protein n=1 Tax=Catenulispora pinistramenti TaxID=2705254 RepID=A0ABS5KJ62_9ACTN|nr:hypothetical protein [Catenulispora pinistramenti]MBS2535236.1 hypothetical protein [Catenulispora pinistramenti]MBS2546060.1 hypothetical protein [Catenulispora pinistramenti]